MHLFINIPSFKTRNWWTLVIMKMHVLPSSVIIHAPFWEFKESQTEEKRNAIIPTKKKKERSSRDVARCPVYGGAFLHFSVWRRSHDLTSSLFPLCISLSHPLSTSYIYVRRFLRSTMYHNYFSYMASDLQNQDREYLFKM